MTVSAQCDSAASAPAADNGSLDLTKFDRLSGLSPRPISAQGQRADLRARDLLGAVIGGEERTGS